MKHSLRPLSQRNPCPLQLSRIVSQRSQNPDILWSKLQNPNSVPKNFLHWPELVQYLTLVSSANVNSPFSLKSKYKHFTKTTHNFNMILSKYIISYEYWVYSVATSRKFSFIDTHFPKSPGLLKSKSSCSLIISFQLYLSPGRISVSSYSSFHLLSLCSADR